MSKFNVLSPIDRKKKAPKFGVMDIEAQDWVKFVVGGVYDSRGFETFGYDDGGMDQMLEWIFDEENDTKIYFCHFGGKYDFLFLFDAIIKLKKKFDFQKLIKRGSMILTISIMAKYSDKKVMFWDSSALLPFALKTLTNSFKVPSLKGEIDYRFIKDIYDNRNYSKQLKSANELLKLSGDPIEHTKIYKRHDLISYLKNDCEGLYQCLEKFYTWKYIKKSGPAFTIASQAMKIFRSYINKPIYGLSKNLDEFIRPAYQGGRVEIFKPVFNSPKKKLYCYDVNSLYPFVMRNFQYPIEFDYRTKKFEADRLGFYDITIDIPKMHVPPLGITHDKKFIFPCGKLRGKWSIHDINCALKVGAKIKKIHSGVIFRSGGFLFRQFIDDFYDIRKNSPSDSVDNIIAKLIMNSSYGKWGISNDKEDIGWEEGIEGETPFATVNIGGKNYRLCSRYVDLRGFSHVAVAAYVTSYARVWMYENYWHPLGENLYYVDTDSLYTDIQMETSNELGKVKLEGVPSNKACFLLPKTYITADKIRMKGVSETAIFSSDYIKNKQNYKNMPIPKECMKFNFLDFYHALQGEKERLKAHIKGRGIFTFSEALRRHKNILTAKEDSIKLIKTEYDKRLIVKIGKPEMWKTEPLIIDNTKINKEKKK